VALRFGAGGEEEEEQSFPALKVLRQYSLVLLVKIRWRDGKALGGKLSMPVFDRNIVPVGGLH
jgi:hypothetical protein